MELTLEQQKAIALASARLRAKGGGNTPITTDPMAADMPAAEPQGGDWERATLLPMEKNNATGERRLAWPQIAVDAGNAMMLPGDVLSGKYTDPNDPNKLDYNNPELIGRGLTLATLPVLGGGGAGGGAAAATATPGRNAVMRALKDSRIPAGEVGERMAAIGPDAILGDLSPRLQKMVQALATMPGPGQKTVLDALTSRAEGRNARLMGDVDTTLGPAPVPSQVLTANKANMDALGPEYQAVFKGAKAVDTTPIAYELDAAIVNLRGDAQKAVKQVRGMLNLYGEDLLDPNPATLFETRQAIDGMLATEANPKAIGALSAARKQIDDMLAVAVPGIKEVDAKYAELARQNTALEDGGKILRTGPEAQRPSEVVEQMVTGANPQGMSVGPSAVPFRLSQGARAEIDRLIGTKANDLQALKSLVGGEGDWNRAKLAAVFGPEKADKLLSIITREMKYQSTEADALTGSRTQVLAAAQKEIEGEQKASPGVIKSLLNLQPGSAVGAAGDKTLGWLGKARRAAVNEDIARLVSSTDGAALVDALGANGGSMMQSVMRAAPVTGTKGSIIERDRIKKAVMRSAGAIGL